MKIFTFISLIFITLLLLGGVTAFDTNNNQTTADNTVITSTTDNSYIDNGINNEDIKTNMREIQQITQADANDDISGAEEQNQISKTIKKDTKTTADITLDKTQKTLKTDDEGNNGQTIIRDVDTLNNDGENYFNERWIYQGSDEIQQVYPQDDYYYCQAIQDLYKVTYFNCPISKQSDTIIDCKFYTDSSEGGVEWGLIGFQDLTLTEDGENDRGIGREFMYTHEETPSWETGEWQLHQFIADSSIRMESSTWIPVQFHINYGKVSVTYQGNTYGEFTLPANRNTELYLCHRTWTGANTYLGDVTITSKTNKKITAHDFSTYVNGEKTDELNVNQEVELTTVLYDENNNVITKGNVQYFYKNTPLADAVAIDSETGKAVLPFTFDESGNLDLFIRYTDDTHEYYSEDIPVLITIIGEPKRIDYYYFYTQVNGEYSENIYVYDEIELISTFTDEEGNTVTQGTVQYFIDDVPIDDAVSIDSSTGNAVLTHTFSSLEEVTLTVKYTDETNTYLPYEFQETRVIEKKPVTLTLDDVYVDTDRTTATIKVRVNPDSLFVTSGSVEFFVGDTSIGTSNVEDDSTASITYTFPEAKEYIIKAVYTSDRYVAYDLTQIIQLNKNYAVIHVESPVEGFCKEELLFNIRVECGGEIVNEGIITLMNEDTELNRTTINSDGSIDIGYTFQEKLYVVYVSYESDNYYAYNTYIDLNLFNKVTIIVENYTCDIDEEITIPIIVMDGEEIIRHGTVEVYDEYDNQWYSQDLSEVDSPEFTYYSDIDETHTLTIMYYDYENIYDETSNYFTVTVVGLPKIPVTLRLDDASGYANDMFRIYAYVSSDDEIINDGAVSFYDENNEIGYAYVSDGCASIYVIYDDVGEHNIRAVYESNVYYADDAYATITIEEQPPKPVDFDVTVMVNGQYTIASEIGDKVDFICYIREVGNYDNIIKKGTVQYFYENGTPLSDAVSIDEDTGISIASHTFNNAGNYPLIIKYVDETEEYASAEYEITFGVNYITGDMDIDDVRAKLGRTVNLKVFVYTSNGDPISGDCTVIFNINDNENTTSEPIPVIDGQAVFAYTIKEGAKKHKSILRQSKL
jgi:hypothetical protein